METVVWGDGDQPTRHNRDVSVTKVGRYRVLRKIETGGAGEVYLGAYDIMGREVRVAIKLLKSSHAHDDASNLRFREEVRMLMELAHPNICRVLDGGDEGGRLYMVMEFADGGSLKDRVKDLPDGRARTVPGAPMARGGGPRATGGRDPCGRARQEGARVPPRHQAGQPVVAGRPRRRRRLRCRQDGRGRARADHHGDACVLDAGVWQPRAVAGSTRRSAERHLLTRGDVLQVAHGRAAAEAFTHLDQRFDEPHDPRLVRPEVPKDLAFIIRKMTEPEVEDRYQSFAELLADLDRLSPDGSKQVRPALWQRLLPVFLVAGAAVAGVLIWRGESPVGQPDPVLVLAEERRRLLLEGVQNAARQLQAEVNGQDQLRPQLASGVPPELRLPAAALAERSADARALLDEAKTEQPNRDLPERLVAIRGRLVAARDAYDTAQDLLKQFEEASAELANRRMPALDELVMRAVPPDNGLLEQRRRQLVAEIRTLHDSRGNQVRELRARFDLGELDLDGLRQQVTKLRDELRLVEETSFADTLDRLSRDIEVALGLQAGLEPWSPTDSLTLRDVERLQKLVEALATSEPPADATQSLQDWWRRRRGDQEQAWRRDLQRAVVELREKLAQQIAALGGDAAPSLELDLAVKDYAAIRAAVLDAKLIEGAVPEALRLPEPKPQQSTDVPVIPKPPPLPAGWPDPSFEPPPGIQSLVLRLGEAEAERLYSREFLREAERRQCRLWYSPARIDKNMNRVYQAFVADEKNRVAALIDIHPMTLAEVREYVTRNDTLTYPRGMWNLPDAAFYSKCSAEFAVTMAGFVNKRAGLDASAYGRFDLAPTGWREWSGCMRLGAPPLLTPIAGAKPELRLPLSRDLAEAGVAYLASGVKEWGRDQQRIVTDQGVSEIAPDEYDLKRDGIGIRLAVWLRRR